MKPRLLPLVTIGLFAMVVADRLSHAFASASREPAVQGPNDTRSATVDLPAAGRPEVPAPAKPPPAIAAPSASSTPTIERLARLAARKQLSRESKLTYLDSLIISTDSVVRRWPDRSGVPLRFSLI